MPHLSTDAAAAILSPSSSSSSAIDRRRRFLCSRAVAGVAAATPSSTSIGFVHQLLYHDDVNHSIADFPVMASNLVIRDGTPPLLAIDGGVGSSASASSAAALDVSIDFTRPDGQRTRPLVVENRRLYVDEHYLSVWSPVLRAWCIECPDRELILANVKYEHMIDVLQCIHPTYKDIDDGNVRIILPIAFDYQMDGLMHRCECYLIGTKLPLLDKLWLADRYKLQRLLVLCLVDLRPHTKIDLTGALYYGLSDRVKVLLLERLHGAQAPQEIAEPPLDADQFHRVSELQFANIKATNGRIYYINPYYMAAWSNVVQERVLANIHDFVCGCNHDELKAFLMAIHPPQLRITESNIAPILMAACKMEAPGLIRKCATFILASTTQLSVFVRFSLLDRCYLHELLDVCLSALTRPEHAIDMTLQQTYECLSTRARAAILDRLSQLLIRPGLQPHHCVRCRHTSACSRVTWICPKCGGYSTADADTSRQTRGGRNEPTIASSSAVGVDK